MNCLDTSLPSPERLEFWNKQWDNDKELGNYRAQEAALTWLFKTYPKNTDLNQVLIKVTALNALYSTHIYHITETARHIIELKEFDKRVQEGDLSLVRDLAVFEVKLRTNKRNPDEKAGDRIREMLHTNESNPDENTREKHIFSFASKYCSWHNPDVYPIYDSKVRDKLRLFKNNPKSGLTYKKGSLETYEGFCKAIAEVREKFCLGPSMKRIDRYLWAWAKSGEGKANESNSSS